MILFKHPSDLSDSDSLDELIDEEDEVAVVAVLRPQLIAEGNIDEDEQPPPIEPDDDREYQPTTDDDTSNVSFEESMEDSNEDSMQGDTVSKNVATRPGRSAECDDGGGEKATTSNGAVSSSVADFDEDDEEDSTVRAIIAAIKKPRSTPPEIKLEDFVTDICFHPEQDIIALGTITGDVHLYQFTNEENTLLRAIEVHAKACRDVEFTDDGRNLLTCSKDKSIMVTDMETEKLKKFYESAHDVAINKLYVIDENLFTTGDDAGTVKLWDLRTKDFVFALKEVEDQITQMLTNDTQKLLLVTSSDGYLTTINLGARKLYVQSEPYEEELNCMGLYRNDSKLVVGTSKGNLYTYNWGQFGYHSDMFPGLKTPLDAMIPITDRIGCVAGEEGIIRACHIAPFRNLGIVGQHSMPVESMDVSSTGELIASSSHNNDVRFWNVKYFEEFSDIKYNAKHNSQKEKNHNLPSSKFSNASDFFADLVKENSGEDDGDSGDEDL